MPIKMLINWFFFLIGFSAVFQQSLTTELRIIGGTTARAGQFPWEAAIYLNRTNGRYFCGGALVSNEWILTAAQCVFGVKYFHIQLGAPTILSPDENRVILTSSTYVAHPDYNQNTLENDVGLIKLHMPIEFSDYINKIEIAKLGNIADGDIVTVAGWGQSRDDAGGITNDLRYVSLSVISNDECRLTYGNQVLSGMVCAVGNYNEGICIGDTGSALMANDLNGQLVHVAIASFMSQNGCESVDPSGFTRTDVYYEWISNVTNVV